MTFFGLVTEELAGCYAGEVHEVTTGDFHYIYDFGGGELDTFYLCSEIDTMYTDTTYYCVGDTLYVGGECNYKGTLEDFSFSCSYVDEQPECTAQFDFAGSGNLSGDTFTYSVMFSNSGTGTNCGGMCTTTFTATATRIGPPICPPPGKRGDFAKLRALARPELR